MGPRLESDRCIAGRLSATFEKQPRVAFSRIRDLLLFLLPRYQAQGKAYVNIALGCTGGRHRSVFFAEELANALRPAGFPPTLLHRNLGSRAADLLEEAQSR